MSSTPQARRSRSNSSYSTLSSVAPSVSSPLRRANHPPPSTSHSIASSRNFTPTSIASRPNLTTASSTVSLSSPRFLRFDASSASLSGAGSVGTSATATTQPGGVSRFRRGHQRKKLGPVSVASANPDELDLMSLEEPDQVFRMFPVREVRGLEKRASDAAAAKVADLRTMVGERYRDLLSAADSIVRMRGAAVKLVDRIDNVHNTVQSTSPSSPQDSPSKRPAKLLNRTSSGPPLAARTLASPPTLSLTIHLLLSIPSTVHTLLESDSYLPAARLEGVARVVYRELSTFGKDDDENDEMDGEQGLLVAFPIIERQWESVAGLGNVIARRAMTELRNWEASPINTAETLAALLMLENASVPSSLSTLLEARSKSLTAILLRFKTRKPSNDVNHLLADLAQLLGLVLQTVEAAGLIFGASPDTHDDGLLLQLLHAVQSPSASAVAETSKKVSLGPILARLPNHQLLNKHLPPSIIEFTPFLSLDSPRHALSPAQAQAQIQAWLEAEMDRVVDGITTALSMIHGGARTLAQVRHAVKASLAAGGDPSAQLHARLNGVIEARLAAVYQSQLDKLVDRVEPSLVGLLQDVHQSAADLDSAEFLFESPLTFPSSAQYGASAKAGHKAHDPFHAFLSKVVKRVEGRSPLADKGLCELEGHARDVRNDLEGWLAATAEDPTDQGSRVRLRALYVDAVRETLGRVHDALLAVTQSVESDVVASLFLGSFAFLLSRSHSFTDDLFLGSAPIQHSQEQAILGEWAGRLSELQAKSLERWRAETVAKAVAKMEEAMNELTATSADTALAAWESSRAAAAKSASPSIPSQPSLAVLSAVRHLNSSVRRVGLHRTQADPAIVRDLLSAFEAKCRVVVKEFVPVVRGLGEPERTQVAVQTAWDLSYLRRVWGVDLGAKGWAKGEAQFVELVDSPTLSGEIQQATLAYVQRTQNAVAFVLAPQAGPAASLLPFGSPTSGGDLKGVGLTGMATPGSRLGLLPTDVRAGGGGGR